MTRSIGELWRATFIQSVQRYENTSTLKDAALQERLTVWTAELTTAVAETCKAMNWQVAAKGHRLELLPISGCEYLGIDVMAFADSHNKWRFPVAAIELENSRNDDRIAYSLWKVLNIRAQLRLVFCYRRTPNQAVSLLEYLREEVVKAMDKANLLQLEGQTLVVIGSRDNSDTFPYGFFKWWQLDIQTASFQKV